MVCEADDITINEILKDDTTIYEYINKVVKLLGEEVSIIMVITTKDKMITVKIK
jgi:hypothetical protein